MNELKGGFKERINDAGKVIWLADSASKTALSSKIDMISSIIGYPKEIVTTSYLTDFYSGIDASSLSTTDQFSNILQTVQNLNTVMTRKWRTDFGTVQLMLFVDWTAADAYYINYMNRIVLPMGIIKWNSFSTLASPSISYGSLGFIVAHEMAHSFDPQNVPFNQYGLYDPLWLSSSTLDQFSAQSSCFQTFYPRYSFNKVRVDGVRTLSQNIADNGGLLVALDVFRKMQNVSLVVLPGLSKYSSEKLFWINFAQTWCSSMDSATLITKMVIPFSVILILCDN